MLKRVMFLVSCLFSSTSLAQGFHLLELDKAYIDTYKNDTVHDPYLAPDDQGLGYGASFNTNLDVVRYGDYRLYMDNNLHFDQEESTGQIRAAGWQYSLNLTLLRLNGRTKLELFRQHHSQHILDRERPDMHFPVYDRSGVRVILYERDNK